MGQSPNKRQTLGSLFPSPEARKETNEARRRKRRAKLKRRTDVDKAASAMVVVSMASTATYVAMTAANTASLTSSKYSPVKKRRRR